MKNKTQWTEAHEKAALEFFATVRVPAIAQKTCRERWMKEKASPEAILKRAKELQAFDKTISDPHNISNTRREQQP